MKHYPFSLLITLLLIFSCQKHEFKPAGYSLYLENVKVALKDSMSLSDYAHLDFSQPVLTRLESEQIYLLRIPFKERSITRDFMLLKTDAAGNIEQGRVVHLERNPSPPTDRNAAISGWDGRIVLRSLNGPFLMRSAVKNGFVKNFHRQFAEHDSSFSYSVNETPEVLVVSSMAQPGVTWSEWISLISLFDGSPGGIGGTPSYGWYSNTDPYTGGGGGGYSGGSGGGSGSGGNNPGPVIIDDPVQIDFETGFEEPAIDIEKYMDCFSAIPDAGATGSIEIFTDIPVDGDPYKIFNFDSGSPGHTFIQLKKNNGSQSVCQNIGFYPWRRPKAALTAGPIEGKFVDNQHHEFNASLQIDLNAAQVNAAVTQILYLANFVKYDIDQYNCTDWALDVFNHTVHATQQLDVPLYDIPGGVPLGSHLPQGLYLLLKELKDAGGSMADNINIPIIGYTGASDGPCN